MELLVVITIIGILVALLLPAIQAAREAARRMTCQNNLRQMGIACHNYNTTIGTFPPGAIALGSPATASSSGLAGLSNWCIALLPYLELQPLFDRYQQGVSNISTLRNQEVLQTSVAVYQCPSDPHSNDLGVPEWGDARGAAVRMRHGSYKCCAGLSDGTFTFVAANMNIAFTWSSGGNWPNAAGNLRSSSTANPRPNIGWRGVMHVVPTGLAAPVAGTGSTGPTTGLKCESMSAIQDGTSNTLMIGEYYNNYVSQDPAPLYGTNSNAAFWGYSYTASWGAPTLAEVTWVSAPPYPLTYFTLGATFWPEPDGCWKMTRSVQNGDLCFRTFASQHPPGGINFVLCDGSTRWVNQTVNPVLLGHMASIAGGRPDESSVVP